ncbi:nicotinamide N-methyltransferase-like [Pecten maximus]|uniref:nicotinamide N-methyltransferase-like n=1 Tax=Pecten maximus TaxID=6579 RepID=UPI0014589CAE|nr:nicotinamide N-methyltransferase-like [Pecten maximus]
MASVMETRDYANFDPYWYIENTVDDDVIEDLDSLHRIFEECKIQGKRLLDIGTGPTIYSVITASNHVDEIFLSDYAPQNLQYLEKWRKGEIASSKMLFDHVINLEGRPMTPEQRENEVREKVKGILPIDVTLEKPLGCDYDGAKFDVIVSTLCLDEAVQHVAELEQTMKNVSGLLNEGGFIIISCDFGATFYRVGEYKYTGVSFTIEEVKSAVVQAGFDVKLYIEIPNNADENWDAEGYYYLVATK